MFRYMDFLTLHEDPDFWRVMRTAIDYLRNQEEDILG